MYMVSDGLEGQELGHTRSRKGIAKVHHLAAIGDIELHLGIDRWNLVWDKVGRGERCFDGRRTRGRNADWTA